MALLMAIVALPHAWGIRDSYVADTSLNQDLDTLEVSQDEQQFDVEAGGPGASNYQRLHSQDDQPGSEGPRKRSSSISERELQPQAKDKVSIDDDLRQSRVWRDANKKQVDVGAAEISNVLDEQICHCTTPNLGRTWGMNNYTCDAVPMLHGDCGSQYCTQVVFAHSALLTACAWSKAFAATTLSNATKGASNITVANASGFTANEQIVIQDNDHTQKVTITLIGGPGGPRSGTTFFISPALDHKFAVDAYVRQVDPSSTPRARPRRNSFTGQKPVTRKTETAQLRPRDYEVIPGLPKIEAWQPGAWVRVTKDIKDGSRVLIHQGWFGPIVEVDADHYMLIEFFTGPPSSSTYSSQGTFTVDVWHRWNLQFIEPLWRTDLQEDKEKTQREVMRSALDLAYEQEDSDTLDFLLSRAMEQHWLSSSEEEEFTKKNEWLKQDAKGAVLLKTTGMFPNLVVPPKHARGKPIGRSIPREKKAEAQEIIKRTRDRIKAKDDFKDEFYDPKDPSTEAVLKQPFSVGKFHTQTGDELRGESQSRDHYLHPWQELKKGDEVETKEDIGTGITKVQEGTRGTVLEDPRWYAQSKVWLEPMVGGVKVRFKAPSSREVLVTWSDTYKLRVLNRETDQSQWGNPFVPGDNVRIRLHKTEGEWTRGTWMWGTIVAVDGDYVYVNFDDLGTRRRQIPWFDPDIEDLPEKNRDHRRNFRKALKTIRKHRTACKMAHERFEENKETFLKGTNPYVEGDVVLFKNTFTKPHWVKAKIEKVLKDGKTVVVEYNIVPQLWNGRNFIPGVHSGEVKTTELDWNDTDRLQDWPEKNERRRREGGAESEPFEFETLLLEIQREEERKHQLELRQRLEKRRAAEEEKRRASSTTTTTTTTAPTAITKVQSTAVSGASGGPQEGKVKKPKTKVVRVVRKDWNFPGGGLAGRYKLGAEKEEKTHRTIEVADQDKSNPSEWDIELQRIWEGKNRLRQWLEKRAANVDDTDWSDEDKTYLYAILHMDGQDSFGAELYSTSQKKQYPGYVAQVDRQNAWVYIWNPTESEGGWMPKTRPADIGAVQGPIWTFKKYRHRVVKKKARDAAGPPQAQEPEPAPLMVLDAKLQAYVLLHAVQMRLADAEVVMEMLCHVEHKVKAYLKNHFDSGNHNARVTIYSVAAFNKGDEITIRPPLAWPPAQKRKIKNIVDVREVKTSSTTYQEGSLEFEEPLANHGEYQHHYWRDEEAQPFDVPKYTMVTKEDPLFDLRFEFAKLWEKLWSKAAQPAYISGGINIRLRTTLSTHRMEANCEGDLFVSALHSFFFDMLSPYVSEVKLVVPAFAQALAGDTWFVSVMQEKVMLPEEQRSAPAQTLAKVKETKAIQDNLAEATMKVLQNVDRENAGSLQDVLELLTFQTLQLWKDFIEVDRQKNSGRNNLFGGPKKPTAKEFSKFGEAALGCRKEMLTQVFARVDQIFKEEKSKHVASSAH
jgi:hypothetical protein